LNDTFYSGWEPYTEAEKKISFTIDNNSFADNKPVKALREIIGIKGDIKNFDAKAITDIQTKRYANTDTSSLDL